MPEAPVSGSASTSKKLYKNVIINDPWSRGTPSYVVPVSVIAKTLAVNPKRHQQNKQKRTGKNGSSGESGGTRGGSSTEESNKEQDPKVEGVLIEGTGRYLTEIAVKARDALVFTVHPSHLLSTRGFDSYKRQAKRDFIRPFPLCSYYHTDLGGSGHCPAGAGCGGIHVDPAMLSLDPSKIQTPCCWHHGDSLASKVGLPVFVIDGHSWKIPVGRWARTEAQASRNNQQTTLRASDICLAHLRAECCAGRRCPKYHICRQWTQKVGLTETLLKERSEGSSEGGQPVVAAPKGTRRKGVLNRWPDGSDEGVSSDEKLLEVCASAHMRHNALQKDSSTSPSDDSTGSNNVRQSHKHSSQSQNGEGSSPDDVTSSSQQRGSGSDDFDPTKPVLLCRNFVEGSCRLGDQCKAAHVDPAFIDSCRNQEVVLKGEDGTVFTVPYADTLMTKGLELYKRRCRASRFTPLPLCQSLYDGVPCRHGAKCAAIHIDLKQFAKMRNKPLRTPCCYHHGDTLSTNKCLVAGLVKDPYVWRFPTGRMARTAAPDRPDLWIDPSDLCIPHLWGRCKHGRQCTKYHICREWLRKVRLLNTLTAHAHSERHARKSGASGTQHTMDTPKTYTPSDSSDGNEQQSTNMYNDAATMGCLRTFKSTEDVGNENEKNDSKSSSDDACPTLLSSDDASPPLLCSTEQQSTPSGSDSSGRRPTSSFKPGFANQNEEGGGEGGEGSISQQHQGPPRTKPRKRKAHASDAV
eukprot:TRINITY_DN1741_c0_g2_i1.p1 TRINITY_DN1741_c0_g2~~TRINITY_DN1741_c0_g2_i1.p1  ORF type:complete len:746 (+),score=201.02 TRINITY_DN1741_c0_g2_i1:62-2299(+)